MDASTVILVINSLLSLVEGVTDSAKLQTVIDALVQWVPKLVEGFADLIPYVQNLINLLLSDGNLTDDQVAQVMALKTQADAAFETAASAAGV